MSKSSPSDVGDTSMVFLAPENLDPVMAASSIGALVRQAGSAGRWVDQREVSRILVGSSRMVDQVERATGPFRWMPCFSNVHTHLLYTEQPIEVDGLTFANTELYFQVMKSKGTKDHVRVLDWIKSRRGRVSPEAAYRMGQMYAIREDWSELRIEIMRRAIRAKFARPELRRLLLSTGDHPLVQLKPSDAFWGTGPDCRGENMLGVLLMELRDGILAEEDERDTPLRAMVGGGAKGKGGAPKGETLNAMMAMQTGIANGTMSLADVGAAMGRLIEYTRKSKNARSETLDDILHGGGSDGRRVKPRLEPAAAATISTIATVVGSRQPPAAAASSSAAADTPAESKTSLRLKRKPGSSMVQRIASLKAVANRALSTMYPHGSTSAFARWWQRQIAAWPLVYDISPTYDRIAADVYAGIADDRSLSRSRRLDVIVADATLHSLDDNIREYLDTTHWTVTALIKPREMGFDVPDGLHKLVDAMASVIYELRYSDKPAGADWINGAMNDAVVEYGGMLNALSHIPNELHAKLRSCMDANNESVWGSLHLPAAVLSSRGAGSMVPASASAYPAAAVQPPVEIRVKTEPGTVRLTQHGGLIDMQSIRVADERAYAAAKRKLGGLLRMESIEVTDDEFKAHYTGKDNVDLAVAVWHSDADLHGDGSFERLADFALRSGKGRGLEFTRALDAALPRRIFTAMHDEITRVSTPSDAPSASSSSPAPASPTWKPMSEAAYEAAKRAVGRQYSPVDSTVARTFKDVYITHYDGYSSDEEADMAYMVYQAREDDDMTPIEHMLLGSDATLTGLAVFLPDDVFERTLAACKAHKLISATQTLSAARPVRQSFRRTMPEAAAASSSSSSSSSSALPMVMSEAFHEFDMEEYVDASEDGATYSDVVDGFNKKHAASGVRDDISIARAALRYSMDADPTDLADAIGKQYALVVAGKARSNLANVRTLPREILNAVTQRIKRLANTDPVFKALADALSSPASSVPPPTTSKKKTTHDDEHRGSRMLSAAAAPPPAAAAAAPRAVAFVDADLASMTIADPPPAKKFDMDAIRRANKAAGLLRDERVNDEIEEDEDDEHFPADGYENITDREFIKSYNGPDDVELALVVWHAGEKWDGMKSYTDLKYHIIEKFKFPDHDVDDTYRANFIRSIVASLPVSMVTEVTELLQGGRYGMRMSDEVAIDDAIEKARLDAGGMSAVVQSESDTDAWVAELVRTSRGVDGIMMYVHEKICQTPDHGERVEFVKSFWPKISPSAQGDVEDEVKEDRQDKDDVDGAVVYKAVSKALGWPEDEESKTEY